MIEILIEKTAKYKISNSIPRFDFSSAGIERMATRANYARNGTIPFTSGPQGPSGDTFTVDRAKGRIVGSLVTGQNPFDQGVDFSTWKFT
jgi:hypothetical protein